MAGLMQYNGNNTRKPNHNVADNRGEVSKFISSRRKQINVLA